MKVVGSFELLLLFGFYLLDVRCAVWNSTSVVLHTYHPIVTKLWLGKWFFFPFICVTLFYWPVKPCLHVQVTLIIIIIVEPVASYLIPWCCKKSWRIKISIKMNYKGELWKKMVQHFQKLGKKKKETLSISGRSWCYLSYDLTSQTWKLGNLMMVNMWPSWNKR